MKKYLFFIFLSLSSIIFAQGTAVDIDGNVYRTVRIGDQEWFADNLKTTRLNNGTSITTEIDSLKWIALEVPAYCWYKNDMATYKPQHGALYNWYAASNSMLCPVGWRVPTENDFYTLIRTLDPASGNPVLLSETAGAKLKENVNTHWAPYAGITASNSSGFTALPSGCRGWSGWYNSSPHFGYFWSSTNWTLALRWATDRVFMNDSVSKHVAISVRCVKAYGLPIVL